MTAAPPPPPPTEPTPDPGWATPAPAAAAAPAARPGLVTAAGITLIVMGVITALVGILFLLGAAIFAGAAGSGIDSPDMPGLGGVLGAFAGVFFVIVILILGWATLQLVSGIYVLGGREWARVLGIVIAIIGGLLALLGLGGEEGNAVFSIVWLVAQAFVVYALFVGKSWFAARTA